MYCIFFWKKYRFTSPEELTTYIDKENLPVEFGGVSIFHVYNFCAFGFPTRTVHINAHVRLSSKIIHSSLRRARGANRFLKALLRTIGEHFLVGS